MVKYENCQWLLVPTIGREAAKWRRADVRRPTGKWTDRRALFINENRLTWLVSMVAPEVQRSLPSRSKWSEISGRQTLDANQRRARLGAVRSGRARAAPRCAHLASARAACG